MYSINTSSYTSYYISWQSFTILRSIYLLTKSTRSIVFYLTFFTIYILFQKFKFIQVFLKLFFANFFLTIINSSNIRKKKQIHEKFITKERNQQRIKISFKKKKKDHVHATSNHSHTIFLFISLCNDGEKSQRSQQRVTII